MACLKTIATVLMLSFCSLSWAQAPGGGGHGGHGGGSGGGSSADTSACFKAKISRFNPAHLATVAPGAEFSFAASGAMGPNHIHVFIKQQPVVVSVADKESFYQVTGKLPEDIKNTTVRISVKIKAKVNKCDAEDGWLLKVTE